MAKNNDTVACLHCGEQIPRNATACPHCGSDENTGWSDKTYLDGIDVGDEIDYDELAEQEFGIKSGKKKEPVSWQMIVGAILLIAFVVLLLRSIL